MSSLVSFIIPVYAPNLDTLKQCLDSVVNQTYKNLEIIIILDRSKNDEIDKEAMKLIHEYNDSRINLIVQDRGGVAHARNVGILNSKGEFLALTDADDICDIHRIELQVKFFETHDADIVGSYVKLIDEKNNMLGIMRVPLDPKNIRHSIMISTPFLNPTAMFRKKIITEGTLYDESFHLASDYEFFMRLIAKGAIGYNIDKPLVLLRENNQSISRKGWLKLNYFYLYSKLKGISLGLRTPEDLFYFFLTLPAVLFNRKGVILAKRTVGRLFSRSIR